ncbi:MAG TPA: hypothetical protein VKC17_04555 [Sphingomicrobium sp.]|nr:hypothetical protein [Sphingomicrobium sp.]
MRDAHKLTLILTAAALAACTKPASDNNVAIDINNAAAADIEQLPPDESVDTSSNELINGADNADVGELNNSASAY